MNIKQCWVAVFALGLLGCGGGGGGSNDVVSTNTAPVADAGIDQAVTTGATVSLSGSGSSDADGNTLTYVWTLTSVPDGSTASLSSASLSSGISSPTAVDTSFVADLDGVYVVSLVVNDSTVSSTADTVSITATTTTNTVPVADAGADQAISTGFTVSLIGVGSDADGDPLTYVWSLTSVPDGSAASLSSTTDAATDFIADLDGTYVASLTVNDGTDDSVADTVSITAATDTNSWTAGVFLDAGTFWSQCELPRSGIDPATGQAFLDVQGDVIDENNFLRSYSNDTYLWYDEIVDRDPGLYSTPVYFDLLKTNETTSSEQPKDKFHFTYPSDEWFDLSQSGVSAGYGVRWVIIAGAPPREVVVAYTEPDSPATDVNLARGAEVLFVDGVDAVNGNTQADVDVLNDAFFPQDGDTHTFTVRDLDGTEREIVMTAEEVTSTPVQNVGVISTLMGEVGYLLFNSHIATAETGLVDAVEELQGITDLVIDLRYNGGGYLDIASEFAYMIAGSGPTTSGEIFEDLVFNDKYPTTNPVTDEALVPVPFHTTTRGFSEPVGELLPTLDMPRVFVLSGPNTCSASEAIMNSLRGVGVEVIQIGSTTCGKPYGFYATGNCGTTYFTIQFRGENNQGFGDYSDGFSPVGVGGTVDDETLPGCSVADDFTHALGDPLEARLAAALVYRDNQECPDPPTGFVAQDAILTSAGSDLSAVDGNAPANIWLQNRIMD